ncbi:MAG: WG repeat-containing protein [Bacteroidetes bacterium]|nr:WG repeat-containing protein [Bacteroidota bacterium]
MPARALWRRFTMRYQFRESYFGKECGLYGLLNSTGNLVLPCIYTNIEFLSPTILKVSNDDKFTYINQAISK